MGILKVAEPITLSGRKGTVSYFDDKLKLVPEKQATIAKVIFDNGTIEFFTIKPQQKPK
jgi:predicted SnoaL-like aldol condensation-catalyzing enzyme